MRAKSADSMTEPQPIWTYKVNADDVSEAGAHFDLVADEDTRAQLALAAGLRSLPRLTASFDVIRRGSGLHVAGEVNATVGQNCVVTLEPIDSDIVEPVDLSFVPDAAPTIADEQGEATIEFGADDVPETLSGGALDLGAVATEFLLLAIDPYPRKEGAVFEPRVAGDPSASPFAALASLKKEGGNGNR
jgi:hypothetical protein